MDHNRPSLRSVPGDTDPVLGRPLAIPWRPGSNCSPLRARGISVGIWGTQTSSTHGRDPDSSPWTRGCDGACLPSLLLHVRGRHPALHPVPLLCPACSGLPGTLGPSRNGRVSVPRGFTRIRRNFGGCVSGLDLLCGQKKGADRGCGLPHLGSLAPSVIAVSVPVSLSLHACGDGAVGL